MHRTIRLRLTAGVAAAVIGSVVAGTGTSAVATSAGHPPSVDTGLGRAGQHPPHCRTRHWVASWSASPTDASAADDPSLHVVPQVLDHQTLRMIITPHLGGSKLRVHLSNRFGSSAVRFGRVSIGRQKSGATAHRTRPVRFDGHRAVSVPAGKDVVSDPVTLHFRRFEPLAVSMYVPSAGAPTKHWNANATSYYSLPGSGDLTKSEKGSAFSAVTESWLYIDGLDVRAGHRTRGVVAFGDSITDGFVAADKTDMRVDSSIADKNGRYPDDLQRRLDKAHRPISVTNAGIGGNKLTAGNFSQQGPSGVSRFRMDAIRQAGVAGILALEGINDLGIPPTATAHQVIGALKSIVRKAHRAQLRIWLGTILPASNSIIDGTASAPNSELYRTKINHWIRRQHRADGVVDFAKALRKPSDHAVLRPKYSGPDHLHPNLAGYREMARTVPLHLLAAAPHRC